MGLSPRIVTEDVVFTWDGSPQRLPKGQVIDVAPGSPLEAAIGLHRLIPHGTPPPQALPEMAEVRGGGGGGGADSVTTGGGGGSGTVKVTPAPPPRSRTVGKKPGSDSKDGAS